MRTGRTKPAGKADVDMTPMLDIVFIMLIFFIVTASFIHERGLQVNHPHPDGPPAPENTAIGFQIDKTNRLYFEGRHVDIWAAEAIIKQKSVEDPKAPVLMQIEKGAHLKSVIRLYDAALKSGVDRGRVAVVTKR